MSIVVHSDPWNKLEIKTEDGKTTFNHVQDCEPITKITTELRNSGAHDGKQGEINLFASIPNTIVYKLKAEYGIDIFRMKYDPGMRKRFLRLMHTEFKDFKTTNRTHL